MKTYSRSYSNRKFAPSEVQEPPAKRRRVESDDLQPFSPVTTEDLRSIRSSRSHSSSPVPSSPTFAGSKLSKDATSNITPPSSPPPLYASPSKSSSVDAPSPARKDGGVATLNPLNEISGNASKQLASKKPRPLVQTQLDLGGKVYKTCKGCGMQYIPSNNGDVELHKRFHKSNHDGIQLSKGFMDAVRTRLSSSGSGSHDIVAVGRSDPAAVRNKAREILQYANTELGSLEMTADTLWGHHVMREESHQPADEKDGVQSSAGGTDLSNSQGERFKVYLLLRKHKCVGVCLAESIYRAHKVVELADNTQTLQQPSIANQSSSIAISPDTDPAMLGISRIWTSKAHRKEGVATALLDCAADNFLYGMKIPQSQIAFSQPTESGGKLARKWFGSGYGWHVYVGAA
jgi:N-acetyltransferase